jgi:hypothetical protein
MWSHYGERHKGICLGFEVQDDILKSIDYTDARIQLTQWKDDNVSYRALTDFALSINSTKGSLALRYSANSAIVANHLRL